MDAGGLREYCGTDDVGFSVGVRRRKLPDCRTQLEQRRVDKQELGRFDRDYPDSLANWRCNARFKSGRRLQFLFSKNADRKAHASARSAIQTLTWAYRRGRS